MENLQKTQPWEENQTQRRLFIVIEVTRWLILQPATTGGAIVSGFQTRSSAHKGLFNSSDIHGSYYCCYCFCRMFLVECQLHFKYGKSLGNLNLLHKTGISVKKEQFCKLEQRVLDPRLRKDVNIGLRRKWLAFQRQFHSSTVNYPQICAVFIKVLL